MNEEYFTKESFSEFSITYICDHNMNEEYFTKESFSEFNNSDFRGSFKKEQLVEKTYEKGIK